MSNQEAFEDFASGLGGRMAAAFADIADTGSAGMWIGDRIEYTASQTLVVADHEALAPAGFELFGWDSICHGGGGGAAGQNFGVGGMRKRLFIPKAWLAGALTAAIMVGAGGVGASGAVGGDSSFAGLLTAKGGAQGNARIPGWTEAPILLESLGSSAGPVYVIKEGLYSGANVPSGYRGGAGGGRQPDFQRGGAVYPHACASEIQSGGAFSGMASAFDNNGSVSNAPSFNLSTYLATLRGNNPNTGFAFAGHIGVGDWPGGGGNGSDVGAGGAGGVPSGGAGACANGFYANGGRGSVILYPVYRKIAA